MLIRRCAWCGKLMGIKFFTWVWGTTHGVCPKCQEHLAREHYKAIKERIRRGYDEDSTNQDE